MKEIQLLKHLSSRLVEELLELNQGDIILFDVDSEPITVADLVTNIKGLSPLGMRYLALWLDSTERTIDYFARKYKIKRDLYPIRKNEHLAFRNNLNRIAFDLGDKLARNPTRDERGLTDELLDMMQVRLGSNLPRDMHLSINVQKPSEKKTGADILFRVIVRRNEITFDRYVLIQAKKYLSKSKKFSETNVGNTHLKNQIAKMHAYNPEFSYILLYSPVTIIPELRNLPYDFIQHDWLFRHFRYGELINDLQFTNDSKIGYPVAFLRSRTWERFTDTAPQNLLACSEIFPDFILDDLITGKIGKEWDSVISGAQGEFSIVLTFSVGVELG